MVPPSGSNDSEDSEDSDMIPIGVAEVVCNDMDANMIDGRMFSNNIVSDHSQSNNASFPISKEPLINVSKNVNDNRISNDQMFYNKFLYDNNQSKNPSFDMSVRPPIDVDNEILPNLSEVEGREEESLLNKDNTVLDGAHSCSHDFNQTTFKRKIINPNSWKKNIPKIKRLRGEDHISRRGKEVEHISIGPSCTSSFCEKSNKRYCQTFSTEDRNYIFNKFWKLESWNERKESFNH